MAYTAIETMRRKNLERFGFDAGPAQPPLYINRRGRNDLKSAALRFIHRRCESLRFDAAKEAQENKTGILQGTSLKPGQIPYNMQMDIDRLCLEKSLESFIDSGIAEDAYAVYYCFLELFFGQYEKSKKMVELLSEYESNGSSLLMKHRDHYSHSVYVFALGLAVYETNDAFRESFRAFYRLENKKENEIAGMFLEYWGLTSLFHDIGYPFELPFEQVLSYFEVDSKERGKGSLYIAYHDVEALTGLDEAAAARFEELYGRRFSTTSELLSCDITAKLGRDYGFTEEYMLDVLNRKPTRPQDFGYFMDHAFFSAARLCQEMIRILKPDKIGRMHVDALSAIMLHNSLYKFAVAFYKDKKPEKRKAPLRMDQHPLAFLLMLCDELQCWDRTSYGRNSRKELHPVSADFDFSNQSVSAVYSYDIKGQEKIEAYERDRAEYEAGRTEKKPRLKAYSDMAGDKPDFTSDIEKIVDTAAIPLKVSLEVRKVSRENKRTYLSESNFLHFYDFAVALHARNMPGNPSKEEMEEKFNACSLEYRLSTLGRTRYFASYLNAIGCFYTDKPVDFEPVARFGANDAAIFAPMEHERWVREHQAMGWRYGSDYESLPLDVPDERAKAVRAALREQLRCHKLCMDGNPNHDEIRAHYQRLPKMYRDLDWKPFNRLLELLDMMEGTRIYRI